MVKVLLSLGLVVFLLGCSTAQRPQPSQAPDTSDVENPLQSPAEEVSMAPATANGQLLLPEEATAGSAAVIVREDDYLIGPADELEISFFQAEELSGARRVNSRGFIRMPLIGTVKVAGLSAEQLEDLLSGIYGEKYLQVPQVSVDITHYASQQVTVLGSVKDPGVYALTGRTTLLQAMAMAGGAERLADQQEIVVFRTQSNGDVIGYLVNLEEVIAGEKKDPEVIGNDRIVVPESGAKSFIKGITDTLRGFVGFRSY